MSYETLVTIGVISLGFLGTICFVVYQVFETRRMRIQYEGGYTEAEIKEILHAEIDPLLETANKKGSK
jgi:hypothetical protein